MNHQEALVVTFENDVREETHISGRTRHICDSYIDEVTWARRITAFTATPAMKPADFVPTVTETTRDATSTRSILSFRRI